jgi:hypothetical protein
LPTLSSHSSRAVAEALAAFETTLTKEPNRFRVIGL